MGQKRLADDSSSFIWVVCVVWQLKSQKTVYVHRKTKT